MHECKSIRSVVGYERGRSARHGGNGPAAATRGIRRSRRSGEGLRTGMDEQYVRGCQCRRAPQSSLDGLLRGGGERAVLRRNPAHPRSEEHTSELQSLMRISYAVFCLKKKKTENK